MKKKFIPYLDAITDIVVGEKNASADVIPLPLLLYEAEKQQTITGREYDDWVHQARAIVETLKIIDRNLKQIGGYKGTKVLQLPNNKVK